MDKIDLKEFAKTRELALKQASKEIDEKVSNIKQLLKEIQEISKLSGVPVSIEWELRDELDEINSLRGQWNSSDC